MRQAVDLSPCGDLHQLMPARDQGSLSPILRTKLYRPPPPPDLVPRERLLARLEAGLGLPLTLVSAPPRVGVLRRVPGVEELVLILDELADGRSVLFLPNAPSPSSGKLLVAKSELVEPIQAKVMAALKVFTDWGQGVGEVLPPARD